MLLGALGGSVFPPAVIAIGALLAAASVAAFALRRRGVLAPRGQRLADRSIVALDVFAAVAVAVLLAPSPDAPAVVLFPLLGFELTLKWGRRGAVAAVSMLALAIGSRLALRIGLLGLGPRPVALVVVCFGTAALVGTGFALRRRDPYRGPAEAGGQAAEAAAAEALCDLVRQLVVGLGAEAAGQDQDAIAELEALAAKAAVSAQARAALAQRCAEVLLVPARAAGEAELVTKREREILALLCKGMSDRKVAAELGLSPGTVRVHISNAMRKLSVANRAAAISALFGTEAALPPVRRSEAGATVPDP